MRAAILFAMVVVAGCLTQPPVQRTVQSDAVSPAQAKPAIAETKAAAAGEKPKDEFKPPSGYKVKKNGDVTLYCREEVLTGSRFPKKICLTEADLKDLESRRESMQEDVARGQRVCTTGSACGS